MQLREIMTPQVEVVAPTVPLVDCARKMRDLNVGAIPVCDGDRLQGMVTDRDLAIRGLAEGLNPKKTRVAEVMSADVAWCYEDQEASDAAAIMREKQIRRLPVLDRQKRLVGIVSLGDLSVKTGDRALAGDTVEAVSEPAQPRH